MGLESEQSTMYGAQTTCPGTVYVAAVGTLGLTEGSGCRRVDPSLEQRAENPDQSTHSYVTNNIRYGMNASGESGTGESDAPSFRCSHLIFQFPAAEAQLHPSSSIFPGFVSPLFRSVVCALIFLWGPWVPCRFATSRVPVTPSP